MPPHHLHSGMTPRQHAHTPGLADSELSANALKQLPSLVGPTDEVAQSNLKALRKLLTDHAVVENALEKLKASTDKCLSQQEILQDKIFLLRAAIAPVRLVPIEVLGIIFGFLVASDPDAIVQVGRVCSRWRQASQFPELWSNIIVAREGSVLSAKVNLFRERSVRCLLKVSYSQSNGATAQWEAWDALMLTAQRWSTVALKFDDCRSASYRIPRLQYSPVMQELSVAIRGASPTASDEGKFGFEDYDIEKTPYLRLLTISTHVLPPPSPWFNALTKLHIIDTFANIHSPQNYLEPIRGLPILQVLQFCPVLVEFTFDGERSTKWLLRNAARVDLRGMSLFLPNLRRLHLSCFFLIGQILLRGITAKNLETMTLRLYPRFESRVHPEPSATADIFFTRSPLLRSLTVYGLNHTAMKHGLCHGIGLGQLEELHLEHTSELQCIAESLSRGLQHNVPWSVPRLSTLTIVSNWFDMPFEEFDLAIRIRHSANGQRGAPSCIRNYVVNGQNLLKGVEPGTTVAFQRPIRFEY